MTTARRIASLTLAALLASALASHSAGAPAASAQRLHAPTQAIAHAAAPALRYATFAGRAATSQATSIATDRAGNTFVVGMSGEGKSSRAFVTKYDPTGTRILYTTTISAPCGATGQGIAVDAAGNAYITGQYGVPSQYNICQIVTDVLVAKIDPTGRVTYQKTFGPSSQDSIAIGVDNEGIAIAVDGAGSAYVTGRCDSDPIDPSIPTTPGALQRGGHGHDGFVLKVDPSGSLAYSTFLGGNNIDEGDAIAVDAQGNAYVTGNTQSADFPTTPDAYQRHFGSIFGVAALGNAFIAELNPTGTALRYASFLGGGIAERGNGIATDGAGTIYVVGATDSPNFPTTPNAYDRTCGTNGRCNVVNVCSAGCANQYPDDAFVAKISTRRPGAAGLLYATFLGGRTNDEAIALAVDRAGHIYVTGETTSLGEFPTANAIQQNLAGGRDAFVSVLDPAQSGTASLLFSTYLGGAKDDGGTGIALGPGSIFVCGFTFSPDFPTRNPMQGTWTGRYGAFVARLTR